MADYSDKDKYHRYEVQQSLKSFFVKFGKVKDPKEPDDDEGGGDWELEPPVHPLLGKAAELAGVYDFENPYIAENAEAREAYELELTHQLQQKQELAQKAAPSAPPPPTLKKG